MTNEETAIERALRSIPPEIRFRVRAEVVAPEPAHEPVAPVAVQRSLFEMETSDE